MTDRERKDYYLKRIKRVLMSLSFCGIPGIGIGLLEKELKIIMWNNSKEWTEDFMKEEVIPLLKMHGIETLPLLKRRGIEAL